MMKTIHTAAYQHLLVLLVKARKGAGLTQRELSERLGRPQSYVSKFERGERRLDVVEFLEVAKGLGVDPHKMLAEINSTLDQSGL